MAKRNSKQFQSYRYFKDNKRKTAKSKTIQGEMKKTKMHLVGKNFPEINNGRKKKEVLSSDRSKIKMLKYTTKRCDPNCMVKRQYRFIYSFCMFSIFVER